VSKRRMFGEVEALLISSKARAGRKGVQCRGHVSYARRVSSPASLKRERGVNILAQLSADQ
jgi:hypothetical protein